MLANNSFFSAITISPGDEPKFLRVVDIVKKEAKEANLTLREKEFIFNYIKEGDKLKETRLNDLNLPISEPIKDY